MKKLIINQKNLPKLNKGGDSNIRIRINKTQTTQNNHEGAVVKKSLACQLQQVDDCLDSLEKYLNNTGSLEEDKVVNMMSFLKLYKEYIQSKQELLTQSLKFSKLKFKTIIQSEDKQNNNANLIVKGQKTLKQMLSSDRIAKIMEKPNNSINKSPKMRKYLSMHKKDNHQNKNIQQPIHEESSRPLNQNSHLLSQNSNLSQQNSFLQPTTNELSPLTTDIRTLKLYTQQQQQIVQSYDQKSLQIRKIRSLYQKQQQPQKLQSRLSQREPSRQQIFQRQQQKGASQQTLQKIITGLRSKISEMNSQLKQKDSQVKELNQRIQQLNLNIENLVKKNTMKSDEFNKLQQEFYDTQQRFTKLQQSLQQKTTRFQNFQKQNQQLKANYQTIFNQLEQAKKQLSVKQQEVQQKQYQINQGLRTIQKLNKSLQDKKISSKVNTNQIQKQLGRYQTAQQFYELTRNDLKQENQQLICILKERQNQLMNLYQILSVNKAENQQEISCFQSRNDFKNLLIV